MSSLRSLFLSQILLLGLSQIVLLGLLSGSAYAESAYEDLTIGAVLPEVIQGWGQPLDKIERAVKREVLWSYPHGAYVLFKDGHVIDWRSLRGRGPRSEKKAAATTPTTDKPAGDIADIVGDIAREVPAGADAPYVEPPQSRNAQIELAPNRIPPQPPGRNQAGIEQSLDLEEDDQ